MKTVAVMQPYFAPYAGYFRLFAAADQVVVLDDAQFPRRGYVHRNRLTKFDGSLGWLTLPLERAPVQTKIKDLEFRPSAAPEMRRRLRAFRAIKTIGLGSNLLVDAISRMDEQQPLEFIVGLLGATCAELSLPFFDFRASTIGVSETLAAQDRIIAIAKECGARIYLNSPGGRMLYQPEAFARAGLKLQFLEPYAGPINSICERLNGESAEIIRSEINSQLMSS